MFSILNSMDAIEGAAVLDLFAGSGALGIEALSRGASRATFVDNDVAALKAVEANLAAVPELRAAARVERGEALAFLARPRATPEPEGWDVVFADPPYAYNDWGPLLAALAGRAGLMVAETGEPLRPTPAWETVKVKTYGGTVVTVAQPVARPGQLGQEGEI
jgi:16S rRNA (guanine966-N2)-methyltransferase